MTEIKLTKRYPNSRTEDITDAYMRGWNDALDAVQNGKFHIADTPQTETSTNSEKLQSRVELKQADCQDTSCPYFKNPDYSRCMKCKSQTDCGWK